MFVITMFGPLRDFLSVSADADVGLTDKLLIPSLAVLNLALHCRLPGELELSNNIRIPDAVILPQIQDPTCLHAWLARATIGWGLLP